GTWRNPTNTASTPTSTRTCRIRAGASAANAASPARAATCSPAASPPCPSTATASRWPRSTTGWTCASGSSADRLALVLAEGHRARPVAVAAGAAGAARLQRRPGAGPGGRTHPRHRRLGPAPAAAQPGGDARAPPARPGLAGPLPPPGRALRLLLCLPASDGVPGTGPGRVLAADPRGHRRAALHHGRLLRLAAAAPAGPDVDPRLDAPARAELGPAAQGRLCRRRAGGAALPLAGQGRPARATAVRGHPRPAAGPARLVALAAGAGRGRG